MGQRLLPDNIPSVIRASATSLTLASTNAGQPTRITVAGQQYKLSSTITLNTGTVGLNGIDTGSLQAAKVYYVYAVVSSGVVGLVISLTGPATGPSGFSTRYKLLGGVLTGQSAALGSKILPLMSNSQDLNYAGIVAVGKLNGSNQSLSPGINNLLRIDTVHTDPIGMLNTSNNRFYAPVSGTYKIVVGAFLRNNTGGSAQNTPTGVGVYKNGSQEALGVGYSQYGSVANGDYNYVTSTFHVVLAQGDYINSTLYSQSANWQAVTFDPNLNYTHTSIELITV